MVVIFAFVRDMFSSHLGVRTRVTDQDLWRPDDLVCDHRAVGLVSTPAQSSPETTGPSSAPRRRFYLTAHLPARAAYPARLSTSDDRAQLSPRASPVIATRSPRDGAP